MSKVYGTEIAKCPHCSKPIGKKHPYYYCMECGKQFPDDIILLLPHFSKSASEEAPQPSGIARESIVLKELQHPKAILWAIVFGFIGLVIGYRIFGKDPFTGQLMPLNYFIANPDEGGVLGLIISEIRDRILGSGIYGAATGIIVGAIWSKSKINVHETIKEGEKSMWGRRRENISIAIGVALILGGLQSFGLIPITGVAGHMKTYKFEHLPTL